MSAQENTFDITFKNQRRLRLRGKGVGTTHKDFGAVTYLYSLDGKHCIIQANSSFIQSANKVDSVNASRRTLPSELTNKASTLFSVVLNDGTKLTCDGIDCLTNHRDLGCKAFVLNERGERTFECEVENLCFMCSEAAIVMDYAGNAAAAKEVAATAKAHDIVISHVDEDSAIAIQLAAALEHAGFTTWYYERDCLPGPQYLLQVPVAIDQASVAVMIISPHSLSSNPPLSHKLSRKTQLGLKWRHSRFRWVTSQ